MYQAERLADGARPTTVNWETGTLSRLFGVMVEMQLVSVNPVRLVEQLSRKSSEREAYISCRTCRQSLRSARSGSDAIIWTAFYTGMRRGEILRLKRQGVDLSDG